MIYVGFVHCCRVF